MTNYLFHALTTATQTDEETGIEPGDRIELVLIIHELYSRPHNIEAVSEIYSDEEIEEAVSNIEEKLGYELEKPEDWDEVRVSPEEMEERAKYAKRAGFHPMSGEFVAR